MKKIYKLLSLTLLIGILFLTGCTNISKPIKGFRKNSVVLTSKLGEKVTITNETDSREVAKILRSFEENPEEAEYKYSFKYKSEDLKGKISGIYSYDYEDDSMTSKYYIRANITYKFIKSKYQEYDEISDLERYQTFVSTYKTLGYLHSGTYFIKNEGYMLDNKLDDQEGIPNLPGGNEDNKKAQHYKDAYNLFEIFKFVKYDLNTPKEYEGCENAYKYSHKISGKYIILKVEQPYGYYSQEVSYRHKKVLESFSNYKITFVNRIEKALSRDSLNLYSQTIYYNVKTNEIEYSYISYDEPFAGLFNNKLPFHKCKFTFETRKVDKEDKVEREIKSLLKYAEKHIYEE